MAKQWHQLEKLDHKALKKLQVEREKAQKLAQDAEEKKRRMIIGVIVMAALLVLGVFVIVMRKRAATLAFQEERNKLLFSRVTEITGKVEARHIGAWEVIKEKIEFDKEYSFKTAPEGAITVQLQLENQVKLAGKSEMTVMPPVLERKQNRKEPVILKRGELTAAISLDGRGILSVESSDIQVTGLQAFSRFSTTMIKTKAKLWSKTALSKSAKNVVAVSQSRFPGFTRLPSAAAISAHPLRQA